MMMLMTVGAKLYQRVIINNMLGLSYAILGLYHLIVVRFIHFNERVQNIVLNAFY